MMSRTKTILLYVMGLLYIAAGLNHFLSPATYLRIMPAYLPAHLLLVYLSGVCEIFLGALVLWPRYRRVAAWGLIALLIAVFPANIEMAWHSVRFPDYPPALLWLRLPVQGVLIAWAYWYTQEK